jgi:hypothetical protein
LKAFSKSIRRTTLAGVALALLCLPLAGCGESQPPAPPAPSKVIEKQLDSKDPKDRLEGAKQAEKMYGSGDDKQK